MGREGVEALAMFAIDELVVNNGGKEDNAPQQRLIQVIGRANVNSKGHGGTRMSRKRSDDVLGFGSH